MFTIAAIKIWSTDLKLVTGIVIYIQTINEGLCRACVAETILERKKNKYIYSQISKQTPHVPAVPEYNKYDNPIVSGYDIDCWSIKKLKLFFIPAYSIEKTLYHFY